ncbi:hypothetical protein Sste5346_008188 [Sporothrix stenoceras]|uniref:Uncharacterized protein n=1 Tax=Sporothrix stenoceras TaxID=5173 RepID=A0ABR3YRP1_9PEZI
MDNDGAPGPDTGASQNQPRPASALTSSSYEILRSHLRQELQQQDLLKQQRQQQAQSAALQQHHQQHQQHQSMDTPFTFSLTHRPKKSESSATIPHDFDTDDKDAASPTKNKTTSTSTSPSKPAANIFDPATFDPNTFTFPSWEQQNPQEPQEPQKHTTEDRTTVAITSVLGNAHSRYSQRQFDEESVQGEGGQGDDNYDDDDGHDDGHDDALDVDLEHDYVLARGGSNKGRGRSTAKHGTTPSRKIHIPVKPGRGLTRRVQHRRVGSGGRSGSGVSGSGMGMGGRAAGGAPLAADGIDPTLAGSTLEPLFNGISGRLQRIQENRHNRFASQQRIRKVRYSQHHQRHHPRNQQLNWTSHNIASLFSSMDERKPSTPARQYVTPHSVWTALAALPGFTFNSAFMQLEWLEDDDKSASADGDDNTDYDRIACLLGAVLADPAIVCSCDKSTCRGRNTGLPQFLVTLFLLAPILHTWSQPGANENETQLQSQQPPWELSDADAAISGLHELGIDDFGDVDMDVQATSVFPVRPDFASENDTRFWSWLAETLFDRFDPSSKHVAALDNDNLDSKDSHHYHTPAQTTSKARRAWITDTYAAPGVGRALCTLVELLVDARRRYLEDDSKDGMGNVDTGGTNETAMIHTLLAARSPTHPCRWGTSVSCTDPICFEGDLDSGLANPMSCCELHDERLGLAVEVWCLWARQGRSALGQLVGGCLASPARPAQYTRSALARLTRQLAARGDARTNVNDQQLERQQDHIDH